MIHADIRLTDAERQPCEIWSRVMGYARPVSAWNVGKKAEWNERKFFTQATATRCGLIQER